MHFNKLTKTILINSTIFRNVANLAARRNNPRIFLYHRFYNGSDPSDGKMDAASFEWQLQQITKKFKTVTFGEYLQMKSSGHSIPSNLSIITVDDGYGDFYEIAYPLLKKYNMSATLFATVNFVEGSIWLWPDRIAYALKTSDQKLVTLKYSNISMELDLRDKQGQRNAFQQLCQYCVDIKNEDKQQLISLLEELLNVKLPETPMDEYFAVTWGQLIEMSQNNIEIGSHTLNHPILSQIPIPDLSDEIYLSKKILQEKLGKDIHTFCYPNGRLADIEGMVIQEVKEAGFTGAVVGVDLLSPFDFYKIPRMPTIRDKMDFLWKLYGMEYLTQCFKKMTGNT